MRDVLFSLVGSLALATVVMISLEADTIEQVERGVFIRFFHRPLSRYLSAARRAGLVLEHMDEPAPPPGFLAQAPEYFEAATVSRLLMLDLRKL